MITLLISVNSIKRLTRVLFELMLLYPGINFRMTKLNPKMAILLIIIE
jgi:hypothetical protein